MASTFKGLGIFNSGPHRFSVDRQGGYVLNNARVDPFLSGSTYIGPLELVVSVRGRLAATTEGGLWTLRDAVRAQIGDPPTPGVLIDHHGRAWNDMSFITLAFEDRVDRGRQWSIGYEARFIDFK